MKKLICLAAILLSAGCSKAIFRPYVGEQQSWPTAEGSIVNTKFDLPIFTSLPPAPYDVIGEIRIESPFFEQPEEGHMPKIVEKTIDIGGDAIVFVQGRLYFSTNYGPRQGDFVPDGKAATLTQVNTFNPESFERGVTVLAIRWLGDPPPGLPARYEEDDAVEMEEMDMELVPVVTDDEVLTLEPMEVDDAAADMEEAAEDMEGAAADMEEAADEMDEAADDAGDVLIIEEAPAPAEEMLPGEVGATP